MVRGTQQPPNPTLFSDPIECWIRGVSLYYGDWYYRMLIVFYIKWAASVVSLPLLHIRIMHASNYTGSQTSHNCLSFASFSLLQVVLGHLCLDSTTWSRSSPYDSYRLEMTRYVYMHSVSGFEGP